jgi:phosphatidylinositol-4,5-bisphosphate 4-phosphatase
VNPNDQVNPNVQVNQVNPAPVIDEDGNTEIEFDIDTITFSFGVNEVAMGQGIWGLHTDQTLWGLVEQHDRENMIKLIGDLNENSYPGGYIGDIFDRLNELAADPNTSPQDRRKLQDLAGQLQREVDTARKMFNSGSYKSGIEDAYKMARSVMRIVNLGAQGLDLLGDDENLLSLSQGCKSNKDRGGMGDVEHKAQVVIEDMGGHVVPGGQFSPQDQTIYNIVLTSSGQDEIQRLNTGLPGSKNAGDLKARINDPEAELTAKALSHHSNA